jgi:hypothetical protein
MIESPKKAQILLSAEQYELLVAYAEQEGKPLSALLREHLEQTLLAELKRRDREAALRWFAVQDLPTDDWENIEPQLEKRWAESEPG